MAQLKGSEEKQLRKTVKCVVWDLDNTLWDGILLEDDTISLQADTVDIIKVLDSRGILHSIASRNEHSLAMQRLEAAGLHEFFLYPQITWNSKAASIKEIARSLNIGLDTIAFVDDQAFERDEVAFSIPEVLCLSLEDVSKMLDMPALNPRFITEDSKVRRQMYLSDIKREQVEKAFEGSNEQFLASLDMVFTISEAREDALQRAEELTLRTHQLNTTGYTYSYDELNEFRRSPFHKLFVSNLDDRYGTYGTIGLTLVECSEDAWTIKLLLMSCRVMSRGVGTIMLNHVMNLARQANVRLEAEFLENGRNRMMYVTYKFAGFKEKAKRGELVILENDLKHVQAFPGYVKVRIER